LVRRGKADPKTLLESQDPDEDSAAGEGESGLNAIALRDYELSKLKYYFAIAELDSVSTSEALYEALDGVELEHSSMTFDLRFVPDDADFTTRTIRDKCTSTATATYRPPDFMVNALQHTNVKCTWDAGDAERGRKLGGTLAQWKDLAESDMQQFLASGSDSDGDGEDLKPSKGPKTSKDKSKSKNMRKILLGQSDEEADSDAGVEDDDFFTHPDDESGESDGADVADKVYNYVSSTAASDSKAESASKEGETPFEAIQRKFAEKKKARKQAKKELKAGATSSDIKAAIHQKLRGAGKKEQAKSAAVASSAAELELMFDASEENDYDMRSVQKAEKLRKKEQERKGKKSKKRGLPDEDTAREETFKVDLQDSRFGKLIHGHSNFGIDPMSSEFKETQGMRDILEAQRKRRKSGASAAAVEPSKSSVGGVDLEALKSKFGNNARKVNKK